MAWHIMAVSAIILKAYFDEQNYQLKQNCPAIVYTCDRKVFCVHNNNNSLGELQNKGD